MRRLTTLSPRRALLGAAVLGAALLAGAGAPRTGEAAMGVGADPIVTICLANPCTGSNVIVVHLTATIYDSVNDITGVTYTMHAPVGTTVQSVLYPIDPNGIPQRFAFYADNPAGIWDTYTNAATTTPGISVTASGQVSNGMTFSANGSSNQNVHVHVGNN